MKLKDWLGLAALALLSWLIIWPPTHGLIRTLAWNHQYLTGLVSFAILGFLGEVMAGRLSGRGYPSLGAGLAYLGLWGLQGLIFALFFFIFNGGVVMTQAAGLLPGGGYGFSRSVVISFFSSFFFTVPFFTSFFLNISLMPLLLILNRLLTATIVTAAEVGKRPSWDQVMAGSNWPNFIKSEVIGGLLFRVPLLTIIFMLPADLWLIMAAWSMALLTGLNGIFRPGKTGEKNT